MTLKLVYNPFDYLSESSESPHSRFLRSSFKTKCKDTFHTFFGERRTVYHEVDLVEELRFGLIDILSGGIACWIAYAADYVQSQGEGLGREQYKNNFDAAHDFDAAQVGSAILDFIHYCLNIIKFIIAVIPTLIAIIPVAISHGISRLIISEEQDVLEESIKIESKNRQVTLKKILEDNKLNFDDIVIVEVTTDEANNKERHLFKKEDLDTVYCSTDDFLSFSFGKVQSHMLSPRIENSLKLLSLISNKNPVLPPYDDEALSDDEPLPPVSP